MPIHDPKRLLCTDCEQETTFVPIGENMIGRPVRRCLECGARRVGVLEAAPTAEIATDGGSVGGGEGDAR